MILVCAGAGAALLVAACLGPQTLVLAIGALLALAAATLAFRHLAPACALWLLVTGCTLEMSLGDLIDPSSYQPIIAMVKAFGLLLAVLAALRYGPRLDFLNPGLGYLAIFGTGLAHGLHPGLTIAESLRSLLGSAAPFAFSFSRLSLGWANAMIRMTALTAPISVGIGGLLAISGIRPLFIDSGGARLAALGHPAFLAGFALAAIYACLIEMFRAGMARWLPLLAANVAILILTGARAPSLYGVAAIMLALLLADSPVMPFRKRLLLLLASAACFPIVLLGTSELTSLRLFNAVSSYAGNLSGREELWPAFEKAAAESPWVGWGLGAGNVIISPDSDVAKLMHTWAAHNEYLRMEVEGGQIGRFLLAALFVLWCARNSLPLARSDRVIIRLVFVLFACHAFTDNVLISTSASVLFAFVSAVFARGRLEAEMAARAVSEPHYAIGPPAFFASHARPAAG